MLQLLELASDAEVPQLAALERVDLARSTVDGEGTRKASLNSVAHFQVKLRAHDGSGCAGLSPTATLLGAGRAVPVILCPATCAGDFEGQYTVPGEMQLPEEGAIFELAVELHGCALGGSPFAVKVEAITMTRPTWKTSFSRATPLLQPDLAEAAQAGRPLPLVEGRARRGARSGESAGGMHAR